MTSALRSIFRMNLSIFALFFSITVTPFHALNLSCAEPSIDHPASAPIKSDKQSAKVFIPYYPHVNKQISSIFKRHSVSSACTSNKNLRDLLSSTKSRQPALHTSKKIYIKSHAKTARPHIADRHLDPCTNAFRSMSAILDLHIVMPPISSSHQH